MNTKYEVTRLYGLKQILEFTAGKTVLDQALPLPRGLKELDRGYEEERVSFTDGSWLVVKGFDAWRYSEVTPGEEAHVEYFAVELK